MGVHIENLVNLNEANLPKEMQKMPQLDDWGVRKPP